MPSQKAIFAKRMVYFCLTAICFVVAFFGWQLTARSAYESAEYTVVEAEKPYEVREYPELKLATTGMSTTSPGSNGSFMRLFKYISGANEQEQKVEMTTPVFMEAASGEKRGSNGLRDPQGCCCWAGS